ncbi:MAG: hypothetical protein KGJ13_10820 [Patescibacteria group bacterium]|nr:hypothetical protein [Patescibacteria group bacterium]
MASAEAASPFTAAGAMARFTGGQGHKIIQKILIQMSAIFIVKYAGWPIRLPSLDLTTPDRASQFISEADAWTEVHRANIDPHHCRVVTLDAAKAEFKEAA